MEIFQISNTLAQEQVGDFFFELKELQEKVDSLSKTVAELKKETNEEKKIVGTINPLNLLEIGPSNAGQNATGKLPNTLFFESVDMMNNGITSLRQNPLYQDFSSLFSTAFERVFGAPPRYDFENTTKGFACTLMKNQLGQNQVRRSASNAKLLIELEQITEYGASKKEARRSLCQKCCKAFEQFGKL